MSRIEIDPNGVRDAANKVDRLSERFLEHCRRLGSMPMPAMPPELNHVQGDLYEMGRPLHLASVTLLGIAGELRRKAFEAEALDKAGPPVEVADKGLGAMDLVGPKKARIAFVPLEGGRVWYFKDWAIKATQRRSAYSSLTKESAFGDWVRYACRAYDSDNAGKAFLNSFRLIEEEGGFLKEGGAAAKFLSRLVPAENMLAKALPVGKVAGRWLGPVGLVPTIFSGWSDMVTGAGYKDWRHPYAQVIGGVGFVGAAVLMVGIATATLPALGVVGVAAGVAVMAYGGWQLGNFVYDNYHEEIGHALGSGMHWAGRATSGIVGQTSSHANGVVRLPRTLVPHAF